MVSVEISVAIGEKVVTAWVDASDWSAMLLEVQTQARECLVEILRCRDGSVKNDQIITA